MTERASESKQNVHLDSPYRNKNVTKRQKNNHICNCFRTGVKRAIRIFGAPEASILRYDFLFKTRFSRKPYLSAYLKPYVKQIVKQNIIFKTIFETICITILKKIRFKTTRIFKTIF